jgi:hypothetical protein
MEQIIVALFFEIAVLVVLLYTIRKQPHVLFLRPILAFSLTGTVIEIMSLLSYKTIGVLPRLTNIYTYTSLMLTNFWCIFWLVSHFTTARKTLLICCTTYTALWITAKLSVEPFSRFNPVTQKMEYPVDSTTFPIFCIAILVAVGFATKNIVRREVNIRNYVGIFWIFAGLASYAFLSLTIPAIQPLVIQALQEKIWWFNDVAFGTQSLCIMWGLWQISCGTPIRISLQKEHIPPVELVTLVLIMVAFFAIKYFVFPDSVGELVGGALVIGFVLLGYNVRYVLVIGYRKLADEEAKTALQKKVQIAMTRLVETKVDDAASSVAVLSSIIDETVKNAPPEASAELETLKHRVDPHIERLVNIYLDIIDEIDEKK